MTEEVISEAILIAVSTSLPITCSPKAEIKCFILPVTIIRYGDKQTNFIVSPKL